MNNSAEELTRDASHSGSLFYRSYPIQEYHAPFIDSYLARLDVVINKALTDYSRVFAFRFDLRFDSIQLGSNGAIITRFIESFKAKIRHNRAVAKDINSRVHETLVRYVWAREYSDEGKPHYHFAIMLNYDAFCTLGCFNLSSACIYTRIVEAWASALSIQKSDAAKLVYFPENSSYKLCRNDQNSINQFFYRASYLCKARSKQISEQPHSFGSSNL